MLKFGILGSGIITDCHFFAIDKLPEIKVAAVASVDEVSGNKACDRYGAKFYGDYEQLLSEEKGLDAIVVALPNFMHYEACICALNNGHKNILCEKPLCVSPEQSGKIVDLAKEKGAMFYTGYMKRFNPGFLRIKELREKLGEVEFVTFSIFVSDAAPKEAPKSPAESWRYDTALSGGWYVTHSGSHHIDLMRHLFGEVKSLSAKCRYDYEKDYYLNAKFEMEGGFDIDMRIGRSDLPGMGWGWEPRPRGWNESIEVVCENGYILVYNPTWEGHDPMTIKCWIKGMDKPEVTTVEGNLQWINEYAAFAESCKTGKLHENTSSVVDGYRTDFLIEQIYASGKRCGDKISVNYKY